MRKQMLSAVLASCCVLSSSSALAVSIDTVLVGNPGNAPDQNYGAGQFGAVAEPFRIGTFEVTNDQYVDFLNAVADADTHGLYKTFPKGEPLGIARSGVNGNFAYSVKPNMGNKPANAVNFWDAARFCNWLHNDQPTGSQGPGTTEDGAYALNGVTNPVNAAIQRSPGAKWFVPTEDQWYKAAYHQPVALGGDGDDYWLYPTRSNQVPAIATANSVGDVSNPGPNVANYAEGADWNGLNGNLTTAGSAGELSKSFYGTFDQAGNVWEWTESIVRGYSYDNHEVLYLSAAGRINSFNPGQYGANGNVGFRVATIAQIPEPCTLALVAVTLVALGLRRRSER